MLCQSESTLRSARNLLYQKSFDVAFIAYQLLNKGGLCQSETWDAAFWNFSLYFVLQLDATSKAI